MLFTEPIFLFLFLPVLLAVYFGAPERYRNIILTISSLIFYAAGEYRFLGWLLGSIVVNYWIAIGLDKYRGTRYSLPLLYLGIASDLVLLLVFKYADFIIANANQLFGVLHLRTFPQPGLLLPLGISFFTFHKISYKIDVYRGTAVVRRKPLDLMLYILLFPQLIAGPIIRYHDIADQLIKRHVDWSVFAEGVRRFVIGLGKKMIIANTVALPADTIFALPANELTPGLAWLGVVCYTFQIYFDFSGYSDMAIGLGKMFGFHFLENFHYPYIATSITEFWRRWHISLSRWFRDYLYIPLGGNRGSAFRTYFNLITVFFLCGLWHGASWNFIVWGLFHGVFLVLERLGLSRWLERMPNVLAHVYTLLAVMVGWVFFRADTLRQAAAFLRAMVGMATGSGIQYHTGLYLNTELMLALFIGVLGSIPLAPAWSHWVTRTGGSAATHAATSLPIISNTAELLFLIAVFLYSTMLIAASSYSPFIYFRF